MKHFQGKKGFMAIKILLEKAYDRLDQNFIINSLKDIGLNDHFWNIIWHFISSSTMDILWNGERTAVFEPLRDIHQVILFPHIFL